MRIQTARSFLTLAAIILFACGDGCILFPEPLEPSTTEMEKWVHDEIPAGSSEDAVKSFAAIHCFSYSPGSNSDGQARAAVLERAVKARGWAGPVIAVNITYNAAMKVETSEVYVFSTEMP